MVINNTKTNYETDTIILKLLTGPGDDALLWFTMKLDDPFEIIMAAYCDSAGLSPDEVVFQYDGDTITETDTPRTIDIEEGEVIQVHKIK